MPPSDSATQNTPLAPSVEKAYYRKCIELKRRLNEVEQANDEMKVKRVRLDRAIMKMRLERAFLLDQLAKRMEQNPEGSEGSGDEGMATPPPDRPHRDKRRRAPTAQSSQPPVLSSQSSQHQRIQPAPAHGSSNASGAQLQYGQEHDGTAGAGRHSGRGRTHSGRSGSYDRAAPVGVPGATAHLNGSGSDGGSREAGLSKTGLSTGSAIQEDTNGERRIVSEERRTNSRSASRDAGGDQAFTTVSRG